MRRVISPCRMCPYRLGIVQTLVDPCPQCRSNRSVARMLELLLNRHKEKKLTEKTLEDE